ncbi:hypothetical protein ACUXST_000999 [Sphingomonas sp. F9_3S_D5_B_2]
MDFQIKSIPESAFEDLVEEIRKFQDSLSKETELGVVANGGERTIHVESFRMAGQMVVFEGVDGEGRAARIIQHYTQVSVQMIAVNKLQSEAKRIGF